ncbi:MAG: hypothetical protein RL670_1153, partial [Actinomycetota bacterium]
MSAPQFQMHRVVGAQARNLNQSQLAVLALPPSAVVAVFGAPGAGKTETLKATLVDRIRSGQLKSADVLAVAATRSSAATLRDELALALQSATKGPLARTLASLAFAVVAGKEMSVGALDPELVSGSEQDQLLQSILNDLDAEGSIAWPESMPLATRSLTGFRAELRDVITVALEHQVSPDELSRLSTSSKYSVWHQVAEVYRRYLAKLASFDRVRFDAATLLQSATDILQGGFWPKNLARPKLILVDDAQELTPAAIRLLQQLVGSESGLILFGDPDASTLGFRAADPKAMSNLVAQINADRGTTSSAIFLDARAERLAPALQRAMAKAAEKVSPELAGRHRLAPIADGASEASAEPNAAIQTAKFDSPSTETAWLADRLRYFHLEQGIAWRDMAVVARTRKQLEELELALANQQVPARIGGARTPLRDEFGSRSLLIVARAALMPDELDLPTIIELLANPFVNLSSVQVRRLRRTLRGKQDPEVSKKNSDELLVELFNNPLAFPDHVSAELVEVQKFLAVFHSVRAQLRERKVGIEHALWGLFTNSAPQSKWLEYAASGGEVAAQASRNLDALSALFAAAKRFAERNPGVAPHEFVERQLALGLPEDTLIKNARSLDWLPLVTPAGLIGQRFKVVALPRLVDGIWPNPKQRSTLLGAAELGQVLRGQEVAVDETANELRMFYKAVGAADQHVLATVSESESDSQSSFFQLVFEVDPASGEYPTGERSLRTLVGKLRRSLVS